MNRPIFDNNTFTNNGALYGNKIGSYPVRMIQSNTKSNKIKLEDAASGINVETQIEVILIDYDNQTMVLENSQIVKITPVTINATISGIDSAKFIAGVAVLDNFALVSRPGQSGVEYEITTNAIDPDIIPSVVDKRNLQSSDYQTIITSNFRF